MKMNFRLIAAAGLFSAPAQIGAAQTPAANPASAAAPRPLALNPITQAAADPKWEEEHAYTLGVQAYEFAFPYLYDDLLRWRWATQPLPDMSVTGQPNTGSSLVLPNVLTHQRKLTDARYRDGGRPNTDTLYSATWADVSKEPMILTVPAFGKRYYTFQLVGFDSDNFDYIGTRTHGGNGGTYAIVGPDWKGELPKGVVATKPAHNKWILVLLRVLVDESPEDLTAVQKLQDQIRLLPLSEYLGKPPGPKYVVQAPLPRAQDPLADWKNINRVLTETPPPPSEAQLMKMFAQIGVGPGQDVEKMSPAIKRGLIRASETGRMIVTSAPRFQAGRAFHQGWGLTPDNWGRPGVDGHYLVRDAKSLGGFVTHDPAENIYPAMLTEPDGTPLSDTRKYVLRFAKGGLPPVDAFWSVTMYDPTFNFVDNPINRYAIGDRTKGLRLDADGTLPIYIQKDRPSDDKLSNWLPSGAGNFHIVLRTYLPKKEILEGKWKPPGIQRVE